jgi:hypothetical protein
MATGRGLGVCFPSEKRKKWVHAEAAEKTRETQRCYPAPQAAKLL